MSNVNGALREHVTRTGFDLSLGKTHIMALVWLDLYLQEESSEFREQSRDFHPLRRSGPQKLLSHSAVGMAGLYQRGLAENLFMLRRDEDGPKAHQLPPSEKFRITEAGRLVVELLKECGIYDEYASVIPVRVVGPNAEDPRGTERAS